MKNVDKHQKEHDFSSGEEAARILSKILGRWRLRAWKKFLRSEVKEKISSKYEDRPQEGLEEAVAVDSTTVHCAATIGAAAALQTRIANSSGSFWFGRTLY